MGSTGQGPADWKKTVIQNPYSSGSQSKPLVRTRTLKVPILVNEKESWKEQELIYSREGNYARKNHKPKNWRKDERRRKKDQER